MTQDDRSTPDGTRRGHRLGRAALGVPLRALSGLISRDVRRPSPGRRLAPALTGEHQAVTSVVGRLGIYRSGPDAETPACEELPLLLIHSINAAASAYEVRPIYERARRRRRVFAIDLPGFGTSDRVRRLYTPRIMTDAIHAAVDAIAQQTGIGAVDALALSLSSEFLARAAVERPHAFRSLALISPTGFDGRTRHGPPGSTRGRPGFYKAVTVGVWRRALFDLLTSRISIRYFLEKTWGSKQIDEGLFDYDCVTARQPGAEHAPFSFISGYLFSNDAQNLYRALTLPVWMAHGVRGDFTSYGGKAAIADRPNWTLDIFDTGALPQFEGPDAFQVRFESFLAALP